jgi:hypothetical protein
MREHLTQLGFCINRKRVRRLMQKLGIEALQQFQIQKGYEELAVCGDGEP